MPHTTSNEIVSPSLGTLPTLDVWDDPRSLTTFRTFHSPNGNSNGDVSETSFYSPSAINGSQQNGGHENAENKNKIQNSHPLPNENVCRVKLGSSKLKGLVLNQVKPVTPPQAYKDIVKFEKTIIGDRIKSPNSLSKSGFAPKPFKAALTDNVINQNSDDSSEKNHLITANGKHETENENGDYLSEQEKQEPSSNCDVVTIDLGLTDKRFGFSVVGGCDEGFLPRIESITPGVVVFAVHRDIVGSVVSRGWNFLKLS